MMGRCSKVNRRGQRCLHSALPHLLHTYSLPKPFGKKSPNERHAVDIFREEVKARAGGYCEVPVEQQVRVCGLPFLHAGEHAHHVQLRSQGGKHEASNGVWLCFDAHRYLHDHPAEANALGLIAMRKVPDAV